MIDFIKLWKEFSPAVAAYLARRFPPDEIGDMTQDIFLKAYDRQELYCPDYPLKVWLFTIVRNYTIDQYRRKSKFDFETFEEDSFAESYSDPEKEYIAKEKIDLFEQVFQTLSLRDRDIVQLFYRQKFKIREISKLLNMPEGTVKYRLSEIRKSLSSKWREIYE